MGLASTPEHIIRDPKLSVGAKAAWGCLASHAEAFTGNQSVWPSQQTIAEYCGVSDRCVRDWIKELEKAGHLHIVTEYTRQGRSSNVYVLHFPEWKGQPEANRKPIGTVVPNADATTQVAEANRKPTGSQPEANRNCGSYEGLEGFQGSEGSEVHSVAIAPTVDLFGQKPVKQDKPKQLLDLWNETANPAMGKSRGVDATMGKIRSALKRDPDLEVWRKRIQWLNNSQHHTGNNDRGWTADLLWMLKPENAEKIDTNLSKVAPVQTFNTGKRERGMNDWRTEMEQYPTIKIKKDV